MLLNNFKKVKVNNNNEVYIGYPKTTFYNDKVIMPGNGVTTQHHYQFCVLNESDLSNHIGHYLRTTNGYFVTDQGEYTMVQVNAGKKGGGYVFRAWTYAGETHQFLLTSDIETINVRFYSNDTSRDTAGFEYSVSNVEVCIDSYEIEDHTLRIKSLEEEHITPEEISALYVWKDKNVVVYGDSITAQGNGDNPGTGSYFYWASQYFQFSNLYGRGIGGQTYGWNNGGWYTAVGTNGNYLDRYKYDSSGQLIREVVSPETITQEEIQNIQNHYGKTIEVHYGSFCSWDRIKTMIPTNLNETIDLVILCGGTNDSGSVTDSEAEPVWVENNNTDPTWAAECSTYGISGDYDITTFNGAIASTVMKMLVRCPNAVVVIATPFPYFDLTTKQQKVNSNGVSFRKLCEIEQNVARKIGADVIDANGKCGINGVNFQDVQTDGVHPNLLGRMMYGRVFIGELKRIHNKV